MLLPVRTVGVMGDGRTYDNVLALRAVTSTDGMTADAFQFLRRLPPRVATRIINEVRAETVTNIDTGPPGTSSGSDGEGVICVV